METMNIVTKILMERDGLTEKEANELIAETREEILDAIDRGDCIYVEEIFEDNLGLEPDYIMDIM